MYFKFIIENINDAIFFTLKILLQMVFQEDNKKKKQLSETFDF
jgi:hypothetical protein